MEKLKSRRALLKVFMINSHLSAREIVQCFSTLHSCEVGKPSLQKGEIEALKSYMTSGNPAKHLKTCLLSSVRFLTYLS